MACKHRLLGESCVQNGLLTAEELQQYLELQKELKDALVNLFTDFDLQALRDKYGDEVLGLLVQTGEGLHSQVGFGIFKIGEIICHMKGISREQINEVIKQIISERISYELNRLLCGFFEHYKFWPQINIVDMRRSYEVEEDMLSGQTEFGKFAKIIGEFEIMPPEDANIQDDEIILRRIPFGIKEKTGELVIQTSFGSKIWAKTFLNYIKILFEKSRNMHCPEIEFKSK